MSTHLKDTDYLFISAKIRAMERSALTQERMERMLQAATPELCAQVLGEMGYPEFDVNSEASLYAALAKERENVFREISASLPDRNIVDVFKLKYDYHNLKTIIKSRGSDVSGLLLDAGRVAPDTLLENYLQRGKWDFLPKELGDAAQEATDVLNETGDPQKCDFILDRAYFKEMLSLAQASRCGYLVNYVRTSIDAANLRDLVRSLRMKRPAAFLRQVLFDGGTISVDQIVAQSGSIAELYRATILKEAAELGEAAVNAGGSLTHFEKALDNALLARAADARRIPFGVEVVIGYIIARENDLTAARIIMTGRMAGIDPETIRERLRDSYV